MIWSASIVWLGNLQKHWLEDWKLDVLQKSELLSATDDKVGAVAHDRATWIVVGLTCFLEARVIAVACECDPRSRLVSSLFTSPFVRDMVLLTVLRYLFWISDELCVQRKLLNWTNRHDRAISYKHGFISLVQLTGSSRTSKEGSRGPSKELTTTVVHDSAVSSYYFWSKYALFFPIKSS